MSITVPTTFPTMFTFLAGSGQYLNWFLQDSVSLQPIISAQITATLYSGRSLTAPTTTPGTAVANFTNVPLKYIQNTKGQYQAIIPATFNPALGSGYVLVVDAAVPGYNNMHWEVAATVASGTVTILQQQFIVTPDQFRNDFREFANTTDYPDSAISFWIGVATLFLNASRWGNALPMGAELFVAHMLVLEKQSVDTASVGGWPGMRVGAINSEAVGVVNVGYDMQSTIEENAGHWGQSVYGSRFLRIAKMMGAGGIQIGPCGGAQPGTVWGADNGTGPAWSGPPAGPGWLGS